MKYYEISVYDEPSGRPAPDRPYPMVTIRQYTETVDEGTGDLTTTTEEHTISGEALFNSLA